MGAQADLDEAIAVGREAVETAPADHPLQAMYLFKLGLALWGRFERAGVQADLDEVISVNREAVQATPADHPNRALYLLEDRRCPCGPHHRHLLYRPRHRRQHSRHQGRCAGTPPRHTRRP